MLGLLHWIAGRLLRLMEDAEDSLSLWDDPFLDDPCDRAAPCGDDPLLAA